MARRASDVDDEGAGRSHGRSMPIADPACLQLRRVVAAQQHIHGRCVQDARLDHGPRALQRFFRRLENELEAAAQCVPPFAQQGGGAQSDDAVHVMAAGMGRARHLGLEGHIGRFCHGQGVQVDAQTDRASGAPGVQHRDDAGARHAAEGASPRAARSRRTMAAVRCSANASSGWRWISRRILTSSSYRPGSRENVVIAPPAPGSARTLRPCR